MTLKKKTPKLNRRDRLQRKVIVALGGKCSACGIKESCVLKVLPKVRAPKDWVTSWARKLQDALEHPDAYRLICHNCSKMGR